LLLVNTAAADLNGTAEGRWEHEMPFPTDEAHIADCQWNIQLQMRFSVPGRGRATTSIRRRSADRNRLLVAPTGGGHTILRFTRLAAVYMLFPAPLCSRGMQSTAHLQRNSLQR